MLEQKFDIKKLNIGELNLLCEEARQKIISTVFKNGGHLSSNLGIVELTVALHYVFDFPNDKIVFDVGHQCYTHKMLSGRFENFDTLRKSGGISGFPKREESKYDCYDTGHAGTSVSAALGIAKARDIQGKDYAVIAVVGDGSFNNGLIYEAFNNLRPLNANILVILNDNGMSISPTVGSMHSYLEELPEVSKSKRAEMGGVFEKFGFEYDGVYDGNDLGKMIEKLSEIKRKLKYKSVILHVTTKKGKGYAFCEENPEATHGISVSAGTAVETEYSEILGKTLVRLAESRKDIAAVTAAMTPNVGLGVFFEKFPERSVDVGICEEHAAILCAAMATQGVKPYFAVYSTFLQRSFDEVALDICEQNLPVTICIDRAGISGADGETHQGVFDLSFLNLIPNLTIAVPKDVKEFEKMLEFSADFNAPLAIRYPREGKRIFDVHEKIVRGKFEKLCKGDSKYTILACGERAVTRALAAAERLKRDGIEIAVYNSRFVKPLDADTLNSLKGCVITVEDNALLGGFGSAVAAFYAEKDVKVKIFAYSDRFIPHGGVDELMRSSGVSADLIYEYVKNENR